MNEDTFDLVISDIRMADGDGLHLLKEVKKRNPHLPVVLFITAYADITEADAYHMGAEAIFKKPVDYDHLIEKVRESLQEKPTRWVRSGERQPVALALNLTFKDYSSIQPDAHVLNVGRGGMFVRFDGDLPKIGETVQFKISFQDASCMPINGSGICRWARREAQLDRPRGFGLEFSSIDEETGMALMELLHKGSMTPFIPIS